MRVAIADPHPMIRASLRTTLRELADPALIVEADTFGGAIEAVHREPDLSLLVLGLAMPDMDPIRGLDAVRNHYDGRIAVVSAIASRRIIEDVLKRGVAGYIPKTLGVEAIRAALGLILAGETFVPSVLMDDQINRTAPDDVLTLRERQIVDLLGEGLSNKGIARRLDIAEVTVKTHMSSAFRKLGVGNRLQASQLAKMCGGDWNATCSTT